MSQRGNEDRKRLRTSYTEWLEHRTILEVYRVRPGDRRTRACNFFCVSGDRNGVCWSPKGTPSAVAASTEGTSRPRGRRRVR